VQGCVDAAHQLPRCDLDLACGDLDVAELRPEHQLVVVTFDLLAARHEPSTDLSTGVNAQLQHLD